MNELEKIRWWHSDYSLKEKIDFLTYRIKSPKHILYEHIDNQINSGSLTISENKPDFNIVFLGDIMPINGLQLEICPRLQRFLDNVDVLVVNLEGVITEKKRFLALQHDKTILSKLNNMTSGKIVVNVANNHAADYGKETLLRSIDLLLESGFDVFGYNNTHFSPKKNICLHAATFWTNQKPTIVNQFKYDGLINRENESAFNIFLPHWGYEMELYPRKEQIKFAQKLINYGWDSIIGNHTHCPQIIHTLSEKIVAYSLGNFCYKNSNPNHWFGRFIQLSFCCANRITPILSRIKNYYTRQKIHQDSISIYLSDELNYQEIRKSIAYDIRYFQDLIK